jgi:hypothetical protein
LRPLRAISNSARTAASEYDLVNLLIR